MRPPPKLTISAWADRFRFLSAEASAEPGRWQTRRTPYLREVMDCVGDAAVHRVVVMKASQVGYTEFLNNSAGYFIDQDPCPILVIQPSIEMAEAWSKDRLAPMLRDSPALRGRVKDPRVRDSGNTIRQKLFAGGHLTMVGANAPSSLASRPIRVVLADEIDRYPVSAGKEGSPLALAAKRQLTFWNRKTMVGGTPTRKRHSAIEREFELSDQRRYYVPCPHCEHPQTLRWEQVRWDKDKDEQGNTLRHHPETAHYVCEECGALWTDAERWAQIAKGEWRAERPFEGVAGFHIPGFLSPWMTLGEIAREFLAAGKDPSKLQPWMNTVLGETFEEEGETVDAGGLRGRAEAYGPDDVPLGVALLTAGVDVQADRLEVQVVGWGAKEESWPVAYEVLHGDPAQDDVWHQLDDLLLQRFEREDGRVLRIRATGIDTGGHHGAQVYAFVRNRRKRRVFACKGAAGVRPIWPKRASRGGHKGTQQVFIVGVDTAKDAIYGRLRIAKPGPGYVHFPADPAFDARYFEQLTAEQVVTRYKEGRPYRIWVLPSGKRNEVLDTFVLALAALKSQPVRLDRLASVEAPADEADAPEETGAAPQAAPPKPAPLAPQRIPARPPVQVQDARRPVVRRSSTWL